jgi:serine/threonine protein kinase
MELQTISKNIKNAKCPEDIFGGPEDGSAILPTYRELVLVIHPDHFQSQPSKLKKAHKAFDRLSHLRAAAERKVKVGTYGQRDIEPPAAKEPFSPIAIKAKGKRFILTDKLAAGDLCDLYNCVISNGGSEIPAIFKIVRQGADNDLVENEAKVLQKLYPPSAKDEKFFRFFPKLIDSFVVRGPGSQRRVNILPWFSEHRSLAEVLEVFPDGIDYRDMVWMFRRILHGIGFAHEDKKLVHGAIIPPHVLIHPVDHGAKIIDWSYAVDSTPPKKPKKKTSTLYDHLIDDTFLTNPHVKAISADYRDYYPPEVFKKETPTPDTDIYMAAKCAIALVGGDVATGTMPKDTPKLIKEFFGSCLHYRFHNAWDAHEKLEKVLERVVGKQRYRPFPMPARVR